MTVEFMEETLVEVDAQKQLDQDQRHARVKAVMADRHWEAYLRQLAPEDDEGAFLLPDEIPDHHAPPRTVRRAIRTASRRAFGHRTIIRVENYVPGIINGLMRILLPQGRELTFHFKEAQGWQATVVLQTEDQPRAITAYYRQRCMNPIRRAAYHNGEVDVSAIQFTPLETTQTQPIKIEPELDRLTERRLPELRQAYQARRYP